MAAAAAPAALPTMPCAERAGVSSAPPGDVAEAGRRMLPSALGSFRHCAETRAWSWAAFGSFSTNSTRPTKNLGVRNYLR